MKPAASPIDWERAERVALGVATRRPAPSFTITGPPHASPTQVEDQIEQATGLRSANGDAVVQLIDRQTWIRANIASFRTLLTPVMDRWQQKTGSSSAAAVSQGRPQGLEQRLRIRVGKRKALLHQAREIGAHPRHAGELRAVGQLVQ